MHRARTAFNLLTPVGQQNFGSWLVRQQKSKVSIFDSKKIKSFESFDAFLLWKRAHMIQVR